MAFAVAEAGLMLLFFLSSSLTFAEPIGIIVLTNSSGVIESPNFPNNYPNNFNGKWRISPETSHVNISIEYFKLEDSSSCKKFDFVQLKARVGYITRETTWCGFISPRQRTLKVDGRAIEITFRSDASFNTKGFKISYRGYDVDPCVHNNGGCSHNCSLVKGARVCSCPEGHRIIYDKRRCTGINSCYFMGNKCPYYRGLQCRDLVNGTGKCVCRKGFKEKDGKCIDINECQDAPDRCGPGTCRNYRGSYSCDCQPGFRQNNTVQPTCVDINECASVKNACDHECINTEGSYNCSCGSGYTLENDNKTCRDINECDHADKSCGNASCINTPGSFECHCPHGYEFDDEIPACKDVNECRSRKHACDQVCINTEGSFMCSCHAGYILSNDSKSCQDKNECDHADLTCGNASCVNIAGSYKCHCSTGYEFDDGLRACKDINECASVKNACNHECTNTEGSYTCSCRPGYFLHKDGKSCEVMPLYPASQVNNELHG
ncbi:fibrillin-1-like isoform X2 [Acropora millepora]|uniref:fibrillin-1-like isoform X2 n=1 Tax=Acropora millepora TaxID=45264 RepID=UPI001CF53F15|nr:fibrillin-1-like isoform X2 [Acropora millepora]